MKFEEYQKLAAQTAIYPERTKIIYPTLGLSGEAGEFCNKVKKVLRDKNGFFDEQIKMDLSKEMGDVLWYLAAIATDLGLSLEQIANDNIEKLFSRKDRGTLGGSGDNR